MSLYLSPPVVKLRAERFVPRRGQKLSVRVNGVDAHLANISESGLGCYLAEPPRDGASETSQARLELVFDDEVLDLGAARVARVETEEAPPESGVLVGLAFSRERPDLIGHLMESLRLPGRPETELADIETDECPSSRTLDQFYEAPSDDVFAKCDQFQTWIQAMHRRGYYQRFYRVTLDGPIDSRVTARGPTRGTKKSLICFDSNSYLGLHLHPKVLASVEARTREFGYGTPSAQLLCGTNRPLRELEETLAEFHERDAVMVFPSGFAANAGSIRALIRGSDALFRDQHAHASIQEACRASGAKRSKVFAHNDMAYLDRMLTHADKLGCAAKMVVTDGVFSMHGELAPLPELLEVCRKHRSRLMVDDAHGVGVLGQEGRGVEEHFGVMGEVDVLMGTLSKAVGAVGGYIAGSRELIDYLRFYAPSGFFTTSLPAPICAGAKTSLELIRSEPEHRVRLWQNIRRFVPQLKAAGLRVSDPVSPIVTVFVGKQDTLWKVSHELFDAGIKCGNVGYPAVPRTGCILRLTINARHTDEDIDFAAEVLARIGAKYGITESEHAQVA